MSTLKFEEIVSPQDKLTDSIEMIKGGMTSNLTFCFSGCKIGDLKPKDKDKGQTTSVTQTPTTSNDTKVVMNP